MTGGKFSGMTTNERLFEAGVLRAFDEACLKRDRRRMIALLNEVELDDQSEWIADTILARARPTEG